MNDPGMTFLVAETHSIINIQYGDDDGIVVLPSEHLEAVYEEAKVRMKKEQEWKLKIEIGASSLDAVGLRESLDAMEIDYQE